MPSPAPQRIFEIRPIRWLLDQGVVVICAGGGGIPTSWTPGEERTLRGVEAVIDKDLASELLAREVDADLFVMATDVDARLRRVGHADAAPARADHRRRAARPSRSPPARWARRSPRRSASSRRPGKRAAIGALEDIEAIVAGTAGTNVVAAT